MTDEEKLTLIQKYEDLPEEEFKEECFEDLKKFAFDKDDTVKTFTASVLSRFVNTAKQARSYAIDSWIYVQQHLCTNETEVIGYLNAILEKESNNNCILNCLYGKYSFGEKNVLNEILNYIKNTDYHIRYSVLAIIQLILEDENYTEECKRKIKITLTELLKREKANAVKEQAEEIMRWL